MLLQIFNFDLRKKFCFVKADRVGQNRVLDSEVFRPYLDFWGKIKNSVKRYFALGYVEAVYQVSAHEWRNYEDASS